MSVLHPKAARDDTKLNKSKTFIKMACVDVRSNHGNELKNAESVQSAL